MNHDTSQNQQAPYPRPGGEGRHLWDELDQCANHIFEDGVQDFSSYLSTDLFQKPLRNCPAVLAMVWSW